ncbi:MAG: HAMP domain-containing sensor histidine kinase [Rhodoferax sp.]|uniref:sensor histidine kinase n=1 Tax=Rhodoferax sp. TaxID=50421 RepID=UPI003263A479
MTPASPAAHLAESDPLALARVWYGFMTARVTIALAILVWHGALLALGQTVSPWMLLFCSGYLASALALRLTGRPSHSHSGHPSKRFWMGTVGVDALVFSTLQLMQSGGSINYSPLLGLPVLLAAVLGRRAIALGTAAGMTLLLLLLDIWKLYTHRAGDEAALFMQSGMTGMGYFVAAFLVNQLAVRLEREEQLALHSQQDAQLQTRVNELVIETLTDGVLVVDASGSARAANPAARLLLGTDSRTGKAPLQLDSQPGWLALLALAQKTFAEESTQQADIRIQHTGRSPRRVRVRTRMTAAEEGQADSLCVMFLHDLREMEARLRTEKMAAMGRMSAAVAHEIRNPLAAITQANALLEEDLTDPAQQRLTTMVRHNAQRLAKIVDEVLEIARVPVRSGHGSAPLQIKLDEAVDTVCRDWSQQDPTRRKVQVSLGTLGLPVDFDPDHLRRVLVNLLDNALRYESGQVGAIQVDTRLLPDRQSSLLVWSDGPPMEQAVEQHLFEPFFSSESRSSGLGLYICRELCERHRASIAYQRATRERGGLAVQGNAFMVQFRPPKPSTLVARSFDIQPV